MRSIRMRLLASMLKPILRWRLSREHDPAKIRAMFDRASKIVFRVPPGALFGETTYASDQPRDGLWVSVGHPKSDNVILYLHGGGYLAGSPWSYRKVVAHLSKATKLRVFVPSFRLAPEDPLPICFDDVLAAYAHLERLGYKPQDIVIGGDSSGGGLTFALLSHLCAQGKQPAAVFAWSPCLDLTYSGASIRENAKRDHMFPGDRVHDLSKLILGETKPDDPRVSPLFATYPDSPPVLLQVANTEILRDDSVRMDDKLRQQGTDVRLEVWDGAPHVWHLLCGYLPEARQAIENTADFIARHTR